MARVILIDDHHIIRDGISAILAHSDADEVVGSQGGLDGLDALIEREQADVVLLDLSLGGRKTFDEISRLKAAHDKLIVIILSMHDDQPSIERAMQAGANGYALKQDAFDDVIFAIRAAERGGRFISPSIIGRGDVLISIEKPQASDLPDRQRQIIEHLAQGKSNKQIAGELGIALPTVKNHLSILFRKYGVQNRVSLLAKLDLTQSDRS